MVAADLPVVLGAAGTRISGNRIYMDHIHPHHKPPVPAVVEGELEAVQHGAYPSIVVPSYSAGDSPEVEVGEHSLAPSAGIT